MKIVVVGAGYVGLANALLFARKFSTVVLDIDSNRVKLLNAKKCTVRDSLGEKILEESDIDLLATLDSSYAYHNADWVIIATPTNYDPHSNYFDTTSVTQVVSEVLSRNCRGNIIIRSTIPVGFVENLRKKYNKQNIIFVPEFLREGSAVQDSLYPSRIIIGEKGTLGKDIAELFLSICEKKDVDLLLTNPTEAEAIKLFANTYLAMRVAFFNELDTYAAYHHLDASDIIKGVSLDPRIGRHYNNPSFGYGGYCLPKDTKQLLANYADIPNELIKAIVTSNDTRKQFIVNDIFSYSPRTVGIYRLVMKSGSDNLRASSVLDIISAIRHKVNIIIYEPMIQDEYFDGLTVCSSLSDLAQQCDLIIANRVTPELEQYSSKIYSRDLFHNN